MNKKGQQMLGLVLAAFFGVIIALSILSAAIIPTIGSSVTTATISNQSVTLPATGSTTDLNGKSASSVIVTNDSSGLIIPASNYTILNNQLNTAGELTAQIQYDGGNYSSTAVNISYVTQPVGYISDSGGRTVALLIVVFSGLAIVVTALVPSLRSGVLDMFGR